MGLDTCTLIATRYDFPVRVEVLDITDKGVSRLILNRLNTIAYNNEKGSTPPLIHQRTYKIDETIIEKIKEDDAIGDSDLGNVHVVHVISGFFSDFKRGISYPELIKHNPLNGKPASKMIDGMKFFMMFEG